ncbi:hypothetical protein [Bradyrhizobium sp. Ce-3]|uniref:hypothetical protein n=1 Tax=Bradyrhizobium sp. Ce-3 TaxID=2913970 RepID=UPI001FC7D181|nr:hypothetical protein [Bradyrhizobium sp. Ce-3]GKQ52143.1 hypothetical protein BRSPCE3_29980 [Bradyrhizobium sp. Ce-3]
MRRLLRLTEVMREQRDPMRSFGHEEDDGAQQDISLPQLILNRKLFNAMARL